MAKGNRTIMLLLVGFIGVGFSYPFIAHFTKPNNYNMQANMPPNTAMRGAFLNTGSKDVGPIDPALFHRHAPKS
jgi:uncharacterized membrane protein